jgi:hypothetical protein
VIIRSNRFRDPLTAFPSQPPTCFSHTQTSFATPEENSYGIELPASFHPGGNLALQFAPAGRQSGGFQNVSGRWIVIQREQKCKAIWVCAETMASCLNY